MLDYEVPNLMKLRTGNVVIKKKDYTTVNNVIDNIKIRYVKSKLPKMNWHN
jgi:hypothetical protein